MKQFIARMLALFGVVPARRYEMLARTADELRNSSMAWKSRAGDLQAQVKSLEHELKRHVRMVKDARRAAERALPGESDVSSLQARLAETERELALAREHLMAVEVKLDILEGAANVLDARTRIVTRRQTSETGAVA